MLINECPLTEPTINHDLLCKKLLELYFEQFLQTFYPELHEKLDFTHQKLLSEEFIADDKTGQKFIADLVIETKFKKTDRSEEHTSELQSRGHLVCRLLLEKKKHQFHLI